MIQVRCVILMSDTPEAYIGVDIGGSKVAAGLVDTEGKILYKTRNCAYRKLPPI